MSRAARPPATRTLRPRTAACPEPGAVSRRACLVRGACSAWPAGLAGCTAPADDSLQQLRQRGRIGVGYAVEPPYADLGTDGQVEGESPLVARRVAQALGLGGIDWVQAGFGELIDDLLAGRFDLVAAGLFVTAERQRRVRFSRPTLQVRDGWLTRPGHPVAGLSHAQARQQGSLRLVVLRGSLEERLLGEGARATVMAAPDARSARALVRSGEADALALSLPTVRHLARQDPEHLVAVAAAAPADAAAAPMRLVALAMRPQEHSLHAAVDAALAAYIGSPRHLQDLLPLGLTADDLPPRAATSG